MGLVKEALTVVKMAAGVAFLHVGMRLVGKAPTDFPDEFPPLVGDDGDVPIPPVIISPTAREMIATPEPRQPKPAPTPPLAGSLQAQLQRK